MAENQVQEQEVPIIKSQFFDSEVTLFGKYKYNVACPEISFDQLIAMNTEKSNVYIPYTAGRYQVKRFRKAQCPIVERLTNSLMRKGRNCGKKLQAVAIVKQAFEIISILTGQNPIEVLLKAVANGSPREDSTKVGKGGAAKKGAVDVAPLRRINLGLYYLVNGARNSAFRSFKSVGECLADEIINCAKESQNSAAFRKREEIERGAKANR